MRIELNIFNYLYYRALKKTKHETCQLRTNIPRSLEIDCLNLVKISLKL